MRTLPPRMVQALAPFAPLFSKHVFRHVQVLLAGTILAPGKRTVASLIRAHALLHQVTRERDAFGRIVATIEDYTAVRELVADLVAEGLEATVPKTVRETVEAVKGMRRSSKGEPVTVAELARELELDRSAVSWRVRNAKDRGYLRT